MRKSIRLSAAGLCILLLAGCSSVAASPGGQKDAASPINIGVIGTFSGSLAVSSVDAEYVMQAWTASVNASGGLAGHPVKLFVEDTGDDPSSGLTEMQTMIQQDHIVAVVGMADDNPTWETYASTAGVPVVGGGGLGLQYLTDPNFYDVGGNLLSVFNALDELAVTHGPKTAILYCAEVPGCAAAGVLEGTLGKPLGLTVALKAGVSATASNFTANCLALKSSGSQSYDLSVTPTEIARIVAQCDQLGYKAPLIEPGTTASSTLTSEPAFNGVTWADAFTPFFEDDTPATEAFHHALAKYEPTVGSSAVPLNPIGIAAWESGQLFAAAIKASGATSKTAITSALVKKGLYAIKGTTLGGLTPPLTYTPGKATAFNCYYSYSIQNGKFVVAPGPQPVCANAATNKLIAGIVASLSK